MLVLTTEPLPLPGLATTGAGLRAWGLAQGLAARGVKVTIAAPAGALSGAEKEVVPDLPVSVRAFSRRPGGIAALLDEVSPDVVVLQHWGIAAEVPELSVPLAIDLAGPHLLERQYWGDPDPEKSFLEKLAALRRTDFLCCSGEFQRHYFLPFAAQAGWDLRAPDLMPVIPFGVNPAEVAATRNQLSEISARDATREPAFIYGGAFLAWQDPSKQLARLADELDRAGRGRLLFYGGAHPVLDASGGKFAEIVEQLSNNPRVEIRPFRPYAEIIEEYRREGTVALDLMARNPERELAYTTRTLVYLACGMPVIYNDYSELSQVIRRHGCGWTLDPQNEQQFREIVRTILTGNAPLREMREAALRAADEHSWTSTIEPLYHFCSAPHFRAEKSAKALSTEATARELRRLRAERDHLNHELATIRGKFLFRFQRRLPGLAMVLAPFAWIAGWALTLRVYLGLRKSAR